ncbi:RDD family protein [Evansella sp. AB-P1]|uniref:RDD family protein n=1 Tax=Evansella sp. AB-P1 TaxID=3037653 RepID=UPI00241E011C|nr:RDD family protein [Evansella sp. AB-P1]MDG5786077.1 RDD family protein [Evansella sp. AB-P1]
METNNPAGFWIRLLANILDGVIMTFVLIFLWLTLYGQVFNETFTFVELISPLYYLILPVIWYGYTIGKRIVGIRIARVDGEKVGIGTMLLRNVVAAIVYGLTLGIGIIVSAFMIGIREDKRAIHDFIASTYVTHDPPEKL